MSDDTAPAPTARIEVVAGGEPSAEELAALVVALTPVAVVGDADEVSASRPGGSAWTEAGLLEGVGFRPFVSVDDLDRYHRNLA